MSRECMVSEEACPSYEPVAREDEIACARRGARTALTPLGTPTRLSDNDLERRLQGLGVMARKSLGATHHSMHASKTYATSATPSIESPHDSVHGRIGGVMGGCEFPLPPCA